MACRVIMIDTTRSLIRIVKTSIITVADKL